MPSLISCTLVLLSALVSFTHAANWKSPEYKYIFQYPLPIAPIKPVTRTYKSANGYDIDYYEVDIKPLTAQIYPNLKPARLVGYDGMTPGPTFMMKKGRQAVVRFINHGDRANSVHLHGSYSRAPFDGWAEDTTNPGQYKDYYYPNAQNARTLWYHDHAIDHTAENAYFGQAGFYILHDEEELAIPGLPQGKYDVPLALNAKQYNSDGTLWSPEANREETSVYGDVIHVNGQPWPYLDVEARPYRFRILNAAVSRTFQLYFEDAKKAGTKIPFTVVGADTGLMENPVTTSDLYTSMAERWEVVFDFSQYAGKNITLRNTPKLAADTDFPATDRVMQFRVKLGAPTEQQQGTLPAKLRTVDYPPSLTAVGRTYRFERTNSQWKINGASWADGPEARILAKPQRGKPEVWELSNPSGGWSHPIHIHLIDFQIISRTGGSRSGVMPYEKPALKDVVWLGPNEVVKVVARWAPWDGVYMFHCHNLIHEDHEMMAAINVTALEDLGYDEKTTFLDPMEEKYRAVDMSDADFSGRAGPFEGGKIDEKLEWFAQLEAYRGDEAEQKLKTYWSGKGYKRSEIVDMTRSTSGFVEIVRKS